MMFMISYVPAEDQENSMNRFNAAVKSNRFISSRANHLSANGTWIVESTNSAAALRNELKNFINADKGDRLFIARMTRNWAGTNMNGGNFPEWLKDKDFGTVDAVEQGPRKDQ